MEPIDTELFGIAHKPQKINSKVKGNRNELTAAHLLSEWTGHEFVRVPQSGALRWQNRMDICGDLINVDKDFDFPYSVETKHYRNLGLAHTAPYIRTNSCIYTFLEQCTRDAIAAKKKPFLMVRENGMRKDLYYIFLPLSFQFHVQILEHTIFQYIGWDQKIAGFKSDQFFKDVTFDLLKKIY